MGALRTICILLGLGLAPLLVPVAAAAEPEGCKGRNPLHCDEAAEGAPEKPAVEAAEEPPDPHLVIDPPGGCAGRNPLYCRETAPEVKPVKTEEPPRREGAIPDSRSQNRNPSQNPNRNPNRNPRRGGSGGQ